jgi:hypothetical protein
VVVEALAGGQHVGRRQTVAGQGGGAGVFLPSPHARVLLRLFPAPGGGSRVNREHRTGQRGPQLTQCLPSGRGQNPRLDRTGIIVGEDPGGLGDQPGFGLVDEALIQGPGRAGQPDFLVQRLVQVGVGGPDAHGQGGRDLVGDELAQLSGEAAGWSGCGPFLGPTAGQLGHDGQQT